jgi:hypothetical protein
MPSSSVLHDWQVDDRRALDQIEAAHRAVGRAGAGAWFAAQQVNQAYVLLLCSRFQRFCRDLHSKCIDHLVLGVPPALRMIVRKQFDTGRKLDVGNPNPGNIGSDFDRLGIRFWPALRAEDPHTESRQRDLAELNRWRNAVAHQDFSHPELGGRDRVSLAEVRSWRRACEQLAVDFERVMHHYLSETTGTAPW